MRKAVRVTLKSFAVAAVVIATLLLIAQDQQTLRVRSAVGASDPRFAAYVSALIGTGTTPGDQIDVLRNGDEFFPALLAAINGAKRRISFETYIYSSGKVADQFTKALADAATRGVVVTIVIDAVGSSDADRGNIDTLQRAGCKIGWFNPVHWYTLEELNYRTHRKILVIDGEVAFTGGAGLADHWLGNARSKDEWRDTHFRITGPAARLMEGAFYENWVETGGEAKPVLDDELPRAGGTVRTMVAWSSPSGGANDLKLLYLYAIAGATRTIDIASPYFITDESTKWVLLEARKRGTRIRIVTEGEITDAMAVKYASRNGYEEFLEAGFEIFEYQPTMMHVKTLVVDGTFSIFGSANFDNRSLELNDELNVAVSDASLGQRITAQFDEDLARSKPLRLEEWRDRPLIDRARERFWGLFAEVF